MNSSQIAELLGGRSLLRRRVRSSDDLIWIIRSGLPSRSFRQVLERFALPQDEVAGALGIPSRTISRRFGQARLSPTESEKVIRLVNAFAFALTVFGQDTSKVTHWFLHANRALGGVPPLRWLDSDIGARRVEEVLGRIQEGVFS